MHESVSLPGILFGTLYVSMLVRASQQTRADRDSVNKLTTDQWDIEQF